MNQVQQYISLGEDLPFTHSYVADHFKKSLLELEEGDQFHTFYLIDRLANNLDQGTREEFEPAHKMQIRYNGYEDFVIKGRSFFLCEVFVRNLLRCEHGDEHQRVILIAMLERAKGHIQDLELEYDTKVKFKIRSTGAETLVTINVDHDFVERISLYV